MSIVLLAGALEHGPDDQQAKFVLVALCNFANKDGIAWPSIKTLERVAGCHRTTVFRKLKFLEKHGWITRVARITLSGATAVNNYWIDAQKLHDARTEYLAELAKSGDQPDDDGNPDSYSMGVAGGQGGARLRQPHGGSPGPPITLITQNLNLRRRRRPRGQPFRMPQERR